MNNFNLHPLFNTPIVVTNIPLSENEQSVLMEHIHLQRWENANQGDDDIFDVNKSKQNKSKWPELSA